MKALDVLNEYKDYIIILERRNGNPVKSPCKDCPNRQIGCHSKCEKYQEYARFCEEQRQTDIAKAHIIIDALKKQIKTLPLDKIIEYDGEYAKCPCCGAIVADYDDIYVCKHCGQALKWGDKE